MAKDLQELINKAKNGAKIVSKVERPAGPVEPKEMVVTASTDFVEDEPDEIVRKHAADLREQQLLQERDKQVNDGVCFLLNAADSIDCSLPTD